MSWALADDDSGDDGAEATRLGVFRHTSERLRPEHKACDETRERLPHRQPTRRRDLPHRPPAAHAVPDPAPPRASRVSWRVNDHPVGAEWAGEHTITAIDASGRRDSVRIVVK